MYISTFITSHSNICLDFLLNLLNILLYHLHFEVQTKMCPCVQRHAGSVHTGEQTPFQTHLPERVPLFWEKLEVFVCELHRWESVEFQVGPRPQEGDQVDERVKTQSIIAVVGQVGHEYTDLESEKKPHKTTDKETKTKGKDEKKRKGKFPFLDIPCVKPQFSAKTQMILSQAANYQELVFVFTRMRH